MKHNFLKATAVLAATTFSVISSETISSKNHISMKKYILTLVSILFSLIFGVSLSAQEFFRIAAHDSSEESKKSADIVCTGEHDELTIQKVLDGSDWVDTMGNAAEPLKPSFDRALIPQPVFDAEPGYVELYWKAWELAYAHVKWQKGLVQPLYMDEGLWDDTIWIWDSEFMVMFCKYAPKLFPGIQTLDNFYYTMLEDSGSSLRIQHPDNPPFFAWVENDYYKITGDRDHIRELLLDKKFPQRYWDLFPTLSPERKLQFDHYPIALKYKGIGYEWSGISSGMDNTPRTRAGKGMLWVDAISQQALSALYISRLAKVAGDGATAREFEKKWKELRVIVNKYYWDDSDGCYYDIVPAPSGETASVADVQASPSAWRTTGILTPASFWPMLAEIPSKAQARRMTEFALRPDKLGGEVPWVTVSRETRTSTRMTAGTGAALCGSRPPIWVSRHWRNMVFRRPLTPRPRRFSRGCSAPTATMNRTQSGNAIPRPHRPRAATTASASVPTSAAGLPSAPYPSSSKTSSASTTLTPPPAPSTGTSVTTAATA